MKIDSGSDDKNVEILSGGGVRNVGANAAGVSVGELDITRFTPRSTPRVLDLPRVGSRAETNQEDTVIN